MTSRQTVATSSRATVPNRAERRHPTKLVTRAEVADYLGVPIATLAKWAHENSGPRYTLVGRHSRYRWADVDRWLDAQRQGGDAA